VTLASKLEIDRASRQNLGQWATLRDTAMQPYDIFVEDLSKTGCRVILNLDLPVGSMVHIGIDGAGMRAARIVRGERPSYGCAFEKPLSESDIQLAAIAETVFAAEFPHLLGGAQETQQASMPVRSGADAKVAWRVSLWVDAAALLAIISFAFYAWGLMHR
jgi:hypothetical protein